MQKGLTALLKAVKLTDPTGFNQAVTTFFKYFTEIAAFSKNLRRL
jgi:hypothetical protein